MHSTLQLVTTGRVFGDDEPPGMALKDVSQDGENLLEITHFSERPQHWYYAHSH